MRKFFVVPAAVFLLLFLLPHGPADATPPTDVEFAVTTTIPPDGPTFGPFIATGPAVDAGVICGSGNTIDVAGKVTGFQSPQGVNIQVLKRFTCEDGSGDFVLKLQVRIDKKGDNFSWVVVEGTGAYADLHGNGSGIGLPICGDDCVLDLLGGGVHID